MKDFKPFCCLFVFLYIYAKQGLNSSFYAYAQRLVMSFRGCKHAVYGA